MARYTSSTNQEAARLESVTKDYPHQQVLKGISFAAMQGEVLLISGPSGSGKSTSIRMIAGLETPTRGTITLFGAHRLDRTNDKQQARLIAEKVSYSQQAPALDDSLTVHENMFLTAQALRPRKERQALIERAASIAVDLGIAKLLLRKADNSLSGGERAKVALGRELVKQPSLLILDEPTKEIDPTGTRDLLLRLQEIQQGTNLSVVMVSHDDEAARLIADREIIIDSGLIVDDISY